MAKITQSGGVKTNLLILLLALAALGYGSFQFGEALYLHAALEADVKDLTRQKTMNPSFNLEQRLVDRFNNVTGDFDQGDLVIEDLHEQRMVKVYAQYQRHVDLTLFTYALPLNVNVSIEKSQAKATFDHVVNSLQDSAKASQQRYKRQLDSSY